MKVLFALAITLLFSLISPAFCQEGPDIFPDEHTRKLARELDLKSVKKVSISGAGWDVTVTDPKVMTLLIQGLKTANTTNFSNKVDYLEVTDENGVVLIEYRFSVSHLPELSPELIEGLKAAGVAPHLWKEVEEAEKTAKMQREFIRRLLIGLSSLALVAFLAFVVFMHKTRPNR